MEQFLKVGIITGTHGLRGDVKVYPTTDDPGRFYELSRVFLRQNGKDMPVTIEKVRPQKNLLLVKFREFEDINEVEGFRQAELYIPREEGAPLAEDEYYIADLIDARVLLEDGSLYGTLTDVMQTGANDVYVVRTTEGREVLLPAIKDCILRVDVEKAEITVHLMKGLDT